MKEDMLKVAVLDMYDGTENLGMHHIMDIVGRYSRLTVTSFDVRGKCELPDLDFDLYILSGGPGSPLEGDGIWDRAFYYFLNKLWKHNQQQENKKHALFICHSFQMAVNFLSLADVVLRRTPSLGVLPVHLTEEGKEEPIFEGLPDPFYVGDFRKWQVIQPNMQRFKNLGCKILALEKIRPHVDLERAIMAIRFSPEWIGTQFHPEADPEGMLVHFADEKRKAEIIEKRGSERYHKMIAHAEDTSKLQVTFDTIIPNFIEQAIIRIDQKKSVKTI